MKRVTLWIAAAAWLGCGSHPPIPAGSTGAFGVVTVDGKQKLYLPLVPPDLTDAGHGEIEVVDVGVAGAGVTGAPALITTIDLGTSAYATATGGDSTVIIAVSTDDNSVWLIDPTKDTVTQHFVLDPSFGPSAFSGGGGYITGVAMDSANHRAILSVWDGFALLDTTAGAITQVIQAAPAENFGFDADAERIIAPFYDCTTSIGGDGGMPPTCANYKAGDGTVMTDGLNVINLKDDSVFTYEDPNATDPHNPVGVEPDSAAADATTGVIVVPSEDSVLENVIDLSHASFDSTNHTFTAPNHPIPLQAYTGVAIEPTRHLAFFEEETSSGVAVVDLNAANSGNPMFVTADVPNPPGTSGLAWSNLGDPHGIAVTTGISNGNSVGFLVDFTRTWVARIDLEKMMSLQQSGTVNDLSPAVTFLNARQAP